MFRLSRPPLPTNLSARTYSLDANRYRKVKAVELRDKKKRLSIPDFDAEKPAVFQRAFEDWPAIKKWFLAPNYPYRYPQELNTAYFEDLAEQTVPLEVTRPSADNAQNETFDRIEAPFSLLLAHMSATEEQQTRLYLAQHLIEDLPAKLKDDLPTPLDFLSHLKAKGDIYSSSLWMGTPPTRTPLHRDPNPNLFVQLAGKKTVRMMTPDVGRRVFEKVQRQMRGAGGDANMRGEEMMKGREMEALESAVWAGFGVEGIQGWEATLRSGDALYIPLGWWHAVRGVGKGANASVGSLILG